MVIKYTTEPQENRLVPQIHSMSAIESNWGNMNFPTPVRSHEELLQFFPYENSDEWWALYSFLNYSSALMVFRFGVPSVVPTFSVPGSLLSVDGSSNSHLFVNNVSHGSPTRFWNSHDNGEWLYLRMNDFSGETGLPEFSTNQSLFIASKYPGEYGDTFSVSIATNLDTLTDTFVWHPEDVNIKTNYSFYELFDRIPNDNEFLVVITKDYEVVESMICSTNENDYNYVENMVFKSVVIHHSGDQETVASCQNVSLAFGVSDVCDEVMKISLVNRMRTSQFMALATIFSYGMTSALATEINSKKLQHQMVISCSDFLTENCLLVAEELKKTIKNPFNDDYISTSYMGDIAGVISQKLNGNSFSEIFTLPERTFEGILSIDEADMDQWELLEADRMNYLIRKGSDFFMETNFSDINDGTLRRYLNIRLLLLYTEVRITAWLQKLIFESDINQTEIRTFLNKIKSKVRKHLKSFDFELTIDDKTIVVDLFQQVGVPFRSLRFNVDYQK